MKSKPHRWMAIYGNKTENKMDGEGEKTRKGKESGGGIKVSEKKNRFTESFT